MQVSAVGVEPNLNYYIGTVSDRDIRSQSDEFYITWERYMWRGSPWQLEKYGIYGTAKEL